MARPVGSPVMPVKPGVRIAAMVKNTVENQPYALPLGVVTQAQQCPVAAKLWINMAVNFGLVF